MLVSGRVYQVHIPYIRCGWEMKSNYTLIKWINYWRLKSEEWKLFKVVCFCCCCRLSNCGHPANRVFCSKAARGTGSKITIHFLKQTWFIRDHQMIHSGRIKQYKSMWFWRISLMTMHCLGWFITHRCSKFWFIEANEVWKTKWIFTPKGDGLVFTTVITNRTHSQEDIDHMIMCCLWESLIVLGFCRGLVIIGIIPNVTVYWNFTRLFLHC